MNKFVMISGAVLAATLSTQAQGVIADWTFETSAPTTAGPYSPEIGAGTATGSHVGTAAVYSSPSGNGSTHSFSSTVWAAGDFYQFEVSTLGVTTPITLSFDQTSSNTGPGMFQLEYSTDGSTFNNIGSAYTVLANASPNTAWSPSTYNAAYTFTPSLASLGSALDNDATLYFRMAAVGTTSANGGVVASGGTDRIDNVIIATPEPTTLALIGVGAAGLYLIRRRK